MAKILCVDDEPSIRKTLNLILRAAGYQVSTAEYAREALARLREGIFDLVLLDALPDAQFVAEAARRSNPHVHILLCTGDFSAESEGIPWVDRVLHKPIPPAELLRVIAATLHNQHQNAA